VSGIAGVAIAADAHALGTLQSSLDALLVAMAHRGGVALPSSGRPSAILREARGIGRASAWADHACALGIQFTPRTPEDAFDRQPLRDTESGCVLVWDGRLDNREELAATLQCEAAQAADSAIVLHAFLRWREQCAAHLLGDFAFAVWDPRAQLLFAARDIMGVRPLFYHSTCGRFAMASEVQALQALPGISREPDQVMAGEALLWWSAFAPIERSFLRDVRRLPPAHWLRWSAHGLRVERYWDVDPRRRIRYQRCEQYVEHYADLLQRSVACRLRAQRPVGIFLSGGMDSSALANVTRRLAPKLEAHALHMQLVDDANDESPLAEQVARQAGLPYHAIPLRGEDVLRELEPYIRLHGVPLADLAFPNDLALLHLAAQRGCGPIFTGDGSDEHFNFPWAYVADLLRSLRWLRLARTLRPYAAYYGRSPFHFAKNSLRYLMPRLPLLMWKRWKWKAGPLWVSQEFARSSGLIERLRAAPWPRFASISAQEDYVALTRGRRVLMDEQREQLASRLGVEYRFPYYDRRLLEFMFSVPWEDKVDGWQVKPFLRRAPGLLPPELRDAPRKANYMQYETRLQRSQNWNSLRPLFDSPPPAAEAFVDFPEARRIARQFLDEGDRSERLTFLTLSVFLLWLATLKFGKSASSGY
jgi:asparagine synthase (glutamine-hydrolysing)